MIHRHCIQQTFQIPLIQLNVPPELINTDASFETMNFVLMLRFQTHNFSLLYQEIVSLNSFANSSKPWMLRHTPDYHRRAVPGPKSSQNRLVNARIDVVLSEKHFCHQLVSMSTLASALMPSSFHSFTAALTL